MVIRFYLNMVITCAALLSLLYANSLLAKEPDTIVTVPKVKIFVLDAGNLVCLESLVYCFADEQESLGRLEHFADFSSDIGEAVVFIEGNLGFSAEQLAQLEARVVQKPSSAAAHLALGLAHFATARQIKNDLPPPEPGKPPKRPPRKFFESIGWTFIHLNEARELLESAEEPVRSDLVMAALGQYGKYFNHYVTGGIFNRDGWYRKIEKKSLQENCNLTAAAYSKLSPVEQASHQEHVAKAVERELGAEELDARALISLLSRMTRDNPDNLVLLRQSGRFQLAVAKKAPNLGVYFPGALDYLRRAADLDPENLAVREEYVEAVRDAVFSGKGGWRQLAFWCREAFIDFPDHSYFYFLYTESTLRDHMRRNGLAWEMEPVAKKHALEQSVKNTMKSIDKVIEADRKRWVYEHLQETYQYFLDEVELDRNDRYAYRHLVGKLNLLKVELQLHQ